MNERPTDPGYNISQIINLVIQEHSANSEIAFRSPLNPESNNRRRDEFEGRSYLNLKLKAIIKSLGIQQPPNGPHKAIYPVEDTISMLDRLAHDIGKHNKLDRIDLTPEMIFSITKRLRAD